MHSLRPAVDDAHYRFEVVLWMMLTWEDPRARPAMEADTAAAANSSDGCAFPCTTLYAWTPGAPWCGGVGCVLTSRVVAQCCCCTLTPLLRPPNLLASARSCDSMWLPHFEFVNARGFSQDRLVRYGVRFRNDTGAVAWWAHVQGERMGGKGSL